MKRRLVKKWINRYITPHVKGLPNTTDFATDLPINENEFIPCNRQHGIKNGYLVPEGYRIPPSNGVRMSIIRTGEVIEQIKRERKYVIVRVPIRVEKNRTYMRLITE